MERNFINLSPSLIQNHRYLKKLSKDDTKIVKEVINTIKQGGIDELGEIYQEILIYSEESIMKSGHSNTEWKKENELEAKELALKAMMYF